MLFVRRKPDDIARPDFFDWAAPTLRPPKAERDDQRLTEWMRMPRGAGPRLERNACAGHACRIGCLEQRINSDGTRKPISRTLCGILRTRSFYLHLPNVVVSGLLSTLNESLSTSVNSHSSRVTFSFDLYDFRASSVVEFNPVAHVRGQHRLAERGNPTDAVSFEIEFLDADDS